MSRRFRFHPDARIEFRGAIRFYRQVSRKLGNEFLEEVLAAIQLIVERPFIGSPFEEGTRRKLLRRFPYALIYRLREERIQIIAVMHTRRKPGYWSDRAR